jgi:hypothetical protein
MPLPIIPVPVFPNVPNAPGVPQLVRTGLAGFYTPTPTLGPSVQAPLFNGSQQPPVWGVFDPNSNLAVIQPDAVFAFDNRNEWKVSDFPVQNGQFATYNKVIIPFEISVRFVKTGTLSTRQQFLKQISDIAGNTNTYNIVTPEVTYLSCNITRYEVTRRDNKDAFALWEVDIYFRQIVQVAAQYSTTQVLGADTTNAQNPAAVPSVNQGVTQSVVPPAAASAAATNAIAGAPL